jgi:Na+-driven multidrug efflux pump
MFNSDQTLVNMGIEAFRRINLIFFSVGPAIIFISFFQGIGRGMKLFFVLTLRQFFVFFPLLYLLAIHFDHPDLWLAFPVADALAIIIGFILSFSDLKKVGIIGKLLINNIKH